MSLFYAYRYLALEGVLEMGIVRLKPQLQAHPHLGIIQRQQIIIKTNQVVSQAKQAREKVSRVVTTALGTTRINPVTSPVRIREIVHLIKEVLLLIKIIMALQVVRQVPLRLLRQVVH